jgi:hypothetical protein
MSDRTSYVKYDEQIFSILLQRLLQDTSYEKDQLVKMITPIIYENETLCRKILDLAIGNTIPEPLPVGTYVKIDMEKVGWLSANEKTILQDNTTNDVIMGTVLGFKGYHSYTPYIIGFPEGKVDLPTEAVLSVGIML